MGGGVERVLDQIQESIRRFAQKSFGEGRDGVGKIRSEVGRWLEQIGEEEVETQRCEEVREEYGEDVIPWDPEIPFPCEVKRSSVEVVGVEAIELGETSECEEKGKVSLGVSLYGDDLKHFFTMRIPEVEKDVDEVGDP